MAHHSTHQNAIGVMRNELFKTTGLRRHQIMMLLDISESTLYRWDAGEPIPREAALVLRSVAHGLPVLMTASSWWADHRFAADGSLRRPNDYPLYPHDLSVFEFLNLNGEIRRMAERHGVDPRPLELVRG